MRVSEIMRTDITSTRLRSSINGEMCIEDIPREYIDAGELYEVVDAKNNKIGEIKGSWLTYLHSSITTLKLGQLINRLDDGVVVVDAEGRICFENEAYCRIIGVPMRKTIGRSMYKIEPDALLLQVLQNGVPMERQRHLIKSVKKHVSMRMFPILENTTVVGAFSIFRDVTTIDALSKEVKRMEGVAAEYSSQIAAVSELNQLQIISLNQPYNNLLSQAMMVARTDATILVRGENGVGKGILVKLIHANSPRKDKPLISVNCAAIPEALIESELFGYEEGAFTGAKKGGKFGKFQLAQGGTLFLDEIGDMPLAMQVKLLRALQEGTIEKIGGGGSITVDVRIIAATNQPIEQLIEEKRFRQDLYYRLNVVSLQVPALRDRREDIIPLANHFLKQFNAKYGKNLMIRNEVYTLFETNDWPGNIRELQNCIESSVIMNSGEYITIDSLPGKLRPHHGADDTPDAPVRHYGTLREELARHEERVIRAVYEQCQGDREEVLKRLQISSRSLYRKLGAKFGE